MRKKSVGSSNDHSKVSRQTVYQRGSQREGSPHYVFLYSDEEDCEDQEDTPLELRTISEAPSRKVEVIKVPLRPEDTLQALALRYHCTISDLKRINNIHKENEIFAHRYIKVPVQPFSIFTENLINHEETTTPSSFQNKDINGQSSETSNKSREEELMNLVDLPIATPIAPQKVNINDIILNSICEPLTTQSADCQSSVTSTEHESEELIPSNERVRSSTPQSNSAIDTFKCSGADWGLSWTHLLGVSLLLGFAGPLFYIFYIAEESTDEHSPK